MPVTFRKSNTIKDGGQSGSAQRESQALGRCLLGAPLKALGELVEQKPAEECLRQDAHDLVRLRVVPSAEADLIVLATEEALVADGDPMGIAPEMAEHRFGTAEALA